MHLRNTRAMRSRSRPTPSRPCQTRSRIHQLFCQPSRKVPSQYTIDCPHPRSYPTVTSSSSRPIAQHCLTTRQSKIPVQYTIDSAHPRHAFAQWRVRPEAVILSTAPTLARIHPLPRVPPRPPAHTPKQSSTPHTSPHVCRKACEQRWCIRITTQHPPSSESGRYGPLERRGVYQHQRIQVPDPSAVAPKPPLVKSHPHPKFPPTRARRLTNSMVHYKHHRQPPHPLPPQPQQRPRPNGLGPPISVAPASHRFSGLLTSAGAGMCDIGSCGGADRGGRARRSGVHGGCGRR